jgi:hypothetical protein
VSCFSWYLWVLFWKYDADFFFSCRTQAEQAKCSKCEPIEVLEDDE